MAATLTHVGYLHRMRVDGLCERCWLPSLMRVTFVIILPDGISEHDHGTHCTTCDRDEP
ncbi:hypothetical protein J2X03_003799 [Microbacterium trichothecenolyticum]|uniref:hypothetical protein n=1 Tax=Microbacterium trichothecenolyticum TaxID=69370 RepID=UPI00285FB8A1|nr:hypothetical protein [Microbacterium trichothecenolyticum]MDR7113897.1 hypothetical protein [Microbacterium trichothecenolyticum]